MPADCIRSDAAVAQSRIALMLNARRRESALREIALRSPGPRADGFADLSDVVLPEAISPGCPVVAGGTVRRSTVAASRVEAKIEGLVMPAWPRPRNDLGELGHAYAG